MQHVNSVALDVAATEIVRSSMLAAAEEAGRAVVRASHSAFIQEAADACAALLGPDGALIAQSVGTSLVHSSSLRAALPHFVEQFPLETLHPGDVLICNDPYRGGIHANDLMVVRPVFADGALRFFAGTLIHVADLGGMAAGGLAATARDYFHEGILVPPVKLAEAGADVDVVWRFLTANSRTPGKVAGDIRALVAGTYVLAQRIEELCDRWGATAVCAIAATWLDDTETLMRHSIAALPDGSWRGSYPIETDGVEHGRTFDVCVEVTIDGDACRLDFTGTSPQSGGAINSSLSQSLSGAIYAVRCFVDPMIPMNEGCFRPIDIRLPRGTMVNPNPPAACGGRIVTVAAAIETIIDALSQASPEHAVGASGLVHVFTMAGTTRPTGDVATPWVSLLYEFGGLGARHGSDGPDADGAFFLGGRRAIPQIEALELNHPIVVRHARLRPDSGGAGRWRGGHGSETEIEVTQDVTVTVRGDRMLRPPPGRDGGSAGAPGFFAVRRRDGSTEQLAPKQTDIRLAAGDALVVATSGGGGLGTPEQPTVPAAPTEAVR